MTDITFSLDSDPEPQKARRSRIHLGSVPADVEDIPVFTPSEERWSENEALLRGLPTWKGFQIPTPQECEPVRVVQKNGQWNIDLGHTLFYETDARVLALKQAQEAARNPLRMGVFYRNRGVPETIGTMRVLNAVQDAIAGSFKPEEAAFLPESEAESEYFYLFGAGLGVHIPALVGVLPIRCLRLVESDPVLLSCAMQVIDFQALRQILLERDGDLEVYCHPDEMVLGTWVKESFNKGHGLYDGTYIHQHHQAMGLETLTQDVIKNFGVLSHPRGFYEDELLMLRNVSTNLTPDDATVSLGSQRFLGHEHPSVFSNRGLAVVCGAGPSLDDTLQWLGRHRESLLVISAGTALDALLNADVRPDFHVELENTPQQFGILSSTAEKYGLQNIVLWGATCIDPRIPGLFDQTVFFMRDYLSPNIVYEHYLPMDQAGPSVSNAALRLAMCLGMRDVMLTGVDWGARSHRSHHASRSVYFTDPDFLGESEAHRRATQYNISRSANFGGRAMTNHIFLLAWGHFDLSVQSFVRQGGQVFNASDGLMINRALPCLPDMLDLVLKIDRLSAEDRMRLLRIFEDLTTPLRGLHHDGGDYQTFFQAFVPHFRQTVQTIMAIMGQVDEDWRHWDRARIDCFDVLEALEVSDSRIPSLVEKLLRGFLICNFAFVVPALRRLETLDERRRFLQMIKPRILDVWRDVEREITGAIDHVLERLSQQNDPSSPDESRTHE